MERKDAKAEKVEAERYRSLQTEIVCSSDTGSSLSPTLQRGREGGGGAECLVSLKLGLLIVVLDSVFF